MIGRIRSAVAWLLGSLAMVRGVVIDAQLRGRMTPRVVDALERRGLHVHRVGAAAFIHDDAGDVRIITAVLGHRSVAPAWIRTLADGHRYLRGRGRPTRRQALELDRRARAWSTSRIRDDRGRYLGRPAWWQGLDRKPLAGFLAPSRAW